MALIRFPYLFHTFPGEETLKRLKYPLNTKLLIVHADDVGVSYSSNLASIKALENGMVSSGSIMMPCKYALDAMAYAKQHPESDLGIHLTLTNEWKNYRWKPLLGEQVPSLLDSEGFLVASRKELVEKAYLPEVERELRAQIEFALANGMKPTHLDCHMFTCLLNPDFIEIYIRLGREYELPVVLNQEKIRKWFHYNIGKQISAQEIPVDQLSIISRRGARKGVANYYREVLLSLRPGLNYLVVHPAFADAETMQMTAGHANFNALWRQSDFDFFTSDECRNIIQDNDICLTNWMEIRSRL